MKSSATIKHVSDTALWVATYRAQESERKDALFRDPLARVLAGERGQRIADGIPYGQVLAWHLVIRTVTLDRLIQSCIAEGCDVVLNLGAGLDTRPYRMDLPESLQWIEVDFAHMMEFKGNRLKHERARCQLQRVSSDLSDLDARRELFDSIGRIGRKVAVLSEGLIPYLSNTEAASLAEDLHAIPQFHDWLLDCRQGGWATWAPKSLQEVLRAAPFKFDAEDMVAFFAQQGWKVRDEVPTTEEAARVGRGYPFVFPQSLLTPFLSAERRARMRQAGLVVRYSR